MRIAAELTALWLVYGLACWFVGRVAGFALGFLGLRFATRPTPESHALAAFAGTGLLCTLFGAASYLGLSGRPAAVAAAAGCAALAGVAFYRGARGLVRVSKIQDLLLLGLAVGCGGGLSLTPSYVGGGPALVGDENAYIDVADYLQDHAFGDAVVLDPAHPNTARSQLFQKVGHRMAPTFFHALVTAAHPHRTALDTYPPVVAWGYTLNVLGIFLAARWAAGASRAAAAGGALVAAVVFSPLYTAVLIGFMHQLYGTGWMLVTLAVAARSAASPSHLRAGAPVVGSSAALWLVSYSEMAPVIVAVLGGWVVAFAVRYRSIGRWRGLANAVVVSLAVFLVLGGHELTRLPRRLPYVHQVLGWHVELTSTQFFGLAIGGAELGPVGTIDSRPATVAFGLLFAAGGWVLVRNGRVVALTALAAFAALTLYFKLYSLDPWTGRVGHTWHLYKIACWVYPLVAAVEAAGLGYLVSGGRLRLVALVIAALAAVWAGPYHLRSSDWSAEQAKRYTKTEAPLRDARRLRRVLADEPGKQIYLMNDEPGTWRRNIGSILFNGRTFANDWRRSVGMFSLDANFYEPRPLPAAGEMLVVTQFPPADVPVRRLPCGYAVVPADRPFASGMMTCDQGVWLESDGMPFTIIGPTKPATVTVWAPSDGTYSFSGVIHPGPALEPGLVTRIIVTVNDATTGAEASARYDSTFSAPIHLQRGENLISVRSAHPTRPGWEKTDQGHRELVVGFTHPALTR
ncbi:hypothetical protein [Fimbriiglobus ruber]|uniref:Glycosyltransferase RgtA/B/C/D-like domain-containing protein n=1 Tax=Fimbriiglobus ruber TaxID=1908690 RepID=A0A225E3I6_9BACT|nr:hypothetical protein [Fimbriiglobus ruber]OWK46314.1 hypothetical protein FRUB_00013 [Fimbriiglobus ruber]